MRPGMSQLLLAVCSAPLPIARSFGFGARDVPLLRRPALAPGHGRAFEGDSWQLVTERGLAFLDHHQAMMGEIAR
jgi:hypothetical protein